MPDTTSYDSELAENAVALAAELLNEAKKHLTPADRAQAKQMKRMMNDPAGKAFTLALADQVFRAPTAKRSARQFRDLLEKHGVPEFLSPHEKVALRLGAFASKFVPQLVMPAVKEKVRSESKNVILSADHHDLIHYLDERRSKGVRMNLNLLGEAVLGEEEAAHRIETNTQLLKSSDVAYISIKISSIFSQISVLAFDQTVATVKERLRQLYRIARDNKFHHLDGTNSSKFINLDMEEYRDLHLTVAVFQQLLDEPEFHQLRAGIVLQAYLPDSFEVQKTLTAWAKKRVAEGGATIKIRIVKGANLAMEQVEASVRDWEQAPYHSKPEVDADYKRMVAFGLQRENAEAVHLGIASHNLFDLAWAILLREKTGAEPWAEFEMLEGMANHQAAVVNERAGGLLFYAPIVHRENFTSAIAYLVRRLDENTAPQNFLHDLFGLEVGTPEWDSQKKRFLDACRDINEPATTPNRSQNRQSESHKFTAEDTFENVADTDWSLACNREWLASGKVPTFPDSQSPEKFTVESLNQALDKAVEGQKTWAALSISDRKNHLLRCAEVLAKHRLDAICLMQVEAKKAVPEGDAEYSEAIDFANYYARSLDPFLEHGTPKPLGVVVITPPWNFPFAIPCGGILAALMAGNSVILKPAPETVQTARLLVEILWEAGIPRDALQFFPCPDNEIGKGLITDERSAAVILTGGWETARMFQSWRPDLKLFAETSGKNSLIISAASDLDLAIKDLVYSAFGHSGQKCSAASLAIVEAEIYDSFGFRRQLLDAAVSLHVGPATDLRSVVTPLIREVGPELERGLTQLGVGEKWLLKPIHHGENLWSPGIRLGVQPGSWYHKTECFGPVLGIIRARNLEHAFAIQNSNSFGLTGGIHSLDREEIDRWQAQVQVGNAYINRKITGAIVNRQPFGGWKRSAIGPGAKAGGPNYVASLCRWEEEIPTQQGLVDDSTGLSRERVAAGTASQKATLPHFQSGHDSSQIHGESNDFRYQPIAGVVLRAEPGLSESDLMLALSAAEMAGCHCELSLCESPAPEWLKDRKALTKVVVESTADFLKRIPRLAEDNARIRVPAGAELAHFEAAYRADIYLDDAAVFVDGHLELLHWHREQAVSDCVHRYGNVSE